MNRNRTACVAVAISTLAPGAHANIPIPAVFGLVAPAWMAWLTFGVSFAVVSLVEAAVLAPLLRARFPHALWAALIANAVTTAFGYLFLHSPLLTALVALAFFAILFGILDKVIDSVPDWRPLARAMAYLPVPAMFAYWGIQALFLGGWGAHQLYLSLVPAFVLTTLIEWCALRGTERRWPRWHVPVIANAASYTLIALTLFAAGMRAEENPLLSPDALAHYIIPGQIEVGNIDGALELTDLMRDLYTGEAPARDWWLQPGDRERRETFPPYFHQRVARDLVAHGHTAEARAIYEELLADADLHDADRAQIADAFAALPSPEVGE